MLSENLPQPSDGAKTWRQDEVDHQLKQLSNRDFHLWSITALVMVVLAAGLLAAISPHLHLRGTALEDHYLPQVFFGLIALVVLFNVYIVNQRRTLSATRWQLVQELMMNERLASVSLVDPLTQVLNRQSMDLVVSRELSRANRSGAALTFLLFQLRKLRSRRSSPEEEQARELARIAACGKLLHDVLRGVDTVLRYSHDTFLVVMPDTSEEQAEAALRRFNGELDEHNLNVQEGLEVTFDHGLASYVRGEPVEHTIRSAARKLAVKRNQLASALIPDFIPEAPKKATDAALPVC
jgi:diguanylate cyclase (GGDEF)-like protein